MEQTADKLQDAKKAIIAEVMEETGWSYHQTVKEIEDAQIRTGINYTEYLKHKFYTIPIEEQGKKFRKILESNAKKNLKSERSKLMYVAKTMAATGWGFDETEKKMMEARRRTSCMYKEYFLYRFYELDEQQQDEIFVANMASKILKKFNKDNPFVEIFNDKSKTNTMFSSYLRRPWCVNNKVSQEEFVNLFKNSTKIIYKPSTGMQGHSIEVFEINPNNIKEVYTLLTELPEGVVEEYVVQHPDMSALYPTSVNTIRVVTISSNSAPVSPDGNYLEIPYTTVRIGGGISSIVDNFHSGGMAAGIDMETGIINTNAVNEKSDVFTSHPVTGTVFKGFKIPYYNEVLDFVTNACKEFNVEGAIGWDIAIAKDGPVLIEINQSPGAVLLSVPHVGEKRGMKHIMEKYLL